MRFDLRIRLAALLSCLLFAPGLWAAGGPFSAIHSQLAGLSLDPAQTYHVRDVRLARGDITIYLNDGVLSFASPVTGKVVGAVFSCVGTDTGDAEVLVMPPGRGERASLAYYTKSPNLDEHFKEAIFLFSDDTLHDVLRQIQQGVVHTVPEEARKLAPQWSEMLRNIAGDLEVPLAESLLNNDPPQLGLFYGLIAGQTLHRFDVIYQPHLEESVTVGSIVDQNNTPIFRVWTSFAPRRRAPPPPDPFTLSHFRIDATIHPDLSMSAVTDFRVTPHVAGRQVLSLEISNRMRVTSASISGQPAEVFQPESIRGSDEFGVSSFLVISPHPLVTGEPVQVEIQHTGSVIQNNGGGVFFVGARNVWFPHRPNDSSTFDLTFRCPSNLQVVSTGKLASDQVIGDVRTVHRVLTSPAEFAGFNLGDFESTTVDHGPFRIECFANRALLASIARDGSTSGAEQRLHEISNETASLLDQYSAMWGPLPIHNVAITPIPGTFGQGFPGLIYLSTLTYLSRDERPPQYQSPLMDIFFSDLLLAHEVAHQWWGNLITPADYRSDWLMEALANYSALQLVERRKGHAEFQQAMIHFRDELIKRDSSGKPVDSTGPVDLGVRLLESTDADAWRVITYDKGTWVMRMLCRRMGTDSFAKFLKQIVEDYAGKQLSNEDFRKLASRFMPVDDPDHTLEFFFDTWVYGSGIPTLALKPAKAQNGEYVLEQTDVDPGFAADVPVIIEAAGEPVVVKWIRSSSDGASFRVPRGAKVTLPAPEDFLYVKQAEPARFRNSISH